MLFRTPSPRCTSGLGSPAVVECQSAVAFPPVLQRFGRSEYKRRRPRKHRPASGDPGEFPGALRKVRHELGDELRDVHAFAQLWDGDQLKRPRLSCTKIRVSVIARQNIAVRADKSKRDRASEQSGDVSVGVKGRRIRLYFPHPVISAEAGCISGRKVRPGWLSGQRKPFRTISRADDREACWLCLRLVLGESRDDRASGQNGKSQAADHVQYLRDVNRVRSDQGTNPEREAVAKGGQSVDKKDQTIQRLHVRDARSPPSFVGLLHKYCNGPEKVTALGRIPLAAPPELLSQPLLPR